MKNKLKFFRKIFNELKNNKELPAIDFHMHTNWTDGKNTAKKMHKQSKSIGLKHILFSEHSRKTSGAWFKKFHDEVKELNTKSCIPYVGTEVKIKNYKGDLDISKKNQKLCDLIMASVHRFPGEKKIKKNKKFIVENKKNAVEKEFKLLISACKNPSVDILGHPFGMSIMRFKIIPELTYFEKVIKESKKNNKIFEINSHYHKKIFKKLIYLCIKNNCLVSFGSNAHEYKFIKNFSKIKYK